MGLGFGVCIITGKLLSLLNLFFESPSLALWPVASVKGAHCLLLALPRKEVNIVAAGAIASNGLPVQS